MIIKNILSRKSFLTKAAGTILGLLFIPGLNRIKTKKIISTVPAKPGSNDKIAVVKSSSITPESINKMVTRAFNEFGGIDHFIRKGMNVVIKPNIAWNSAPERAHNTNPYLVEIVAEMCKKAGAGVTIFDRTCNSARLSYINSGIRQAAENAGVDIEFIDDRKFKEINVPHGLNLKKLSVYKPLLDADFVINMPIAKHHSSSELTISMKNLMGVIGGSRGSLHWNLHENIVDFTKTIKVDLIICDCLRILTAHGPNGGSLKDVKETKTIIMGTNPVSIDAYATTLFGKSPSKIDYIRLAAKEGMGEINPEKMNLKRITV
ncbi:MAG: DUF362 domain-containing protein [Spirochaetes bacterium]|nr:DUF362 domain-containing protein [Spirochaetota bacterium]